jgi:hypothetical protein
MRVRTREALERFRSRFEECLGKRFVDFYDIGPGMFGDVEQQLPDPTGVQYRIGYRLIPECHGAPRCVRVAKKYPTSDTMTQRGERRMVA